jgi:hypothetical protein
MLRHLYSLIKPTPGMTHTIRLIGPGQSHRFQPNLREISSQEFPLPCPGTSQGIVYGDGYRGGIVYACRPDGLDAGIAYAVLRFDRGCHVSVGSPNDEAQAGHPIHAVQRTHAPMIEVVNSPWAGEFDRRSHNQGVLIEPNACRHLIMFFKENTIELLAETIELAGTFPTVAVACAEAIRVSGMPESVNPA